MLRRSAVATRTSRFLNRCLSSQAIKEESLAQSNAGVTSPALPPCDFVPPLYHGPTKEEVFKLRKTFLSPAIFHYFQDPIMITDGHMQYLFDETGKRYLDAFAGIVTVSVGHCHPKVLAAIRAQQDRLQVGEDGFLDHDCRGLWKTVYEMHSDTNMTLKMKKQRRHTIEWEISSWCSN